jgi:hypothetical protein
MGGWETPILLDPLERANLSHQLREWEFQWFRLTLSNGPNKCRCFPTPYLRTKTDLVSETLCFFFSEYQSLNEVQKSGIPVCYIIVSTLWNLFSSVIYAWIYLRLTVLRVIRSGWLFLICMCLELDLHVCHDSWGVLLLLELLVCEGEKSRYTSDVFYS